MKKIIRLTESDLARIVKRTIREMDENDYTADDAIAEIGSYIDMVGCSEGRSRLLDDLNRMVDEAERELSEEEFDKLSDYVYDLEGEIYENCSDEDEDEEESLYESNITRIVKQVITESKKKPSKSEILKMTKEELKDVYGKLEVKGEYLNPKNKGPFHNFKRTAIGDVVCSFRTDDTTPSGLKRNTQGIKVKNLDF